MARFHGITFSMGLAALIAAAPYSHASDSGPSEGFRRQAELKNHIDALGNDIEKADECRQWYRDNYMASQPKTTGPLDEGMKESCTALVRQFYKITSFHDIKWGIGLTIEKLHDRQSDLATQYFANHISLLRQASR